MVEVPHAPHREHPLQDGLARLLGVPIDGRASIVQDMFTRHRSDAVSYWLQIVLATGIATLGLVLSSTGVVIGAMLISPLMSPIVGLGMGLAVGAPLLTLRSMFRVVASIIWVMGLAALLTIGLPFHETTTEISARTSPTVLDLVVAGFCALAAGFTTARHTDTTSTAAGTAIGISLVPPLCVAGYGMGVGQWAITGGALLLFTANFCAIIFCSTLLFVGLGFNHVILHGDDAATGVGGRVARRLRTIFGTRYGVMWRLILPALLLASVYVPLRAALGEVAWKIRVRAEVTRILRELAPESRSVQTSLAVETHTVRIQLALIGSHEEASRVEESLRVRVAAAAGVEPVVDVTAVADDLALQRIAESVAAPRPTPLPLAPPPARLADLRQPIADVLAAHWPSVGGRLRRWQIEFDADGAATVRVEHVGPHLGAAAESLLGDLVRAAVGGSITVRSDPVPTGRWSADDGLTAEFLQRLAWALTAAQTHDIQACVIRPGAPSEATSDPAAAQADLTRTALTLLTSVQGAEVEVREGVVWSVELVDDACPPVPPVPEVPAGEAASPPRDVDEPRRTSPGRRTAVRPGAAEPGGAAAGAAPR